LTEALQTPRAVFEDPVYAAIQASVKDRMSRKGYPHPDGNLKRLIDLEYAEFRTNLPKESSEGYRFLREGYRFLRLVPFDGRPAFPKLESVRTPLVMVHAANDPLSPAQEVADMLRSIDNPTVAAVFLPSGGHVGFVAYSKQYYYSLIASFFDPVDGAAAQGDGRFHLADRSVAAPQTPGGEASAAAQ
jgi:pimeloyl-ACP methyl ester carboxylesterase